MQRSGPSPAPVTAGAGQAASGAAQAAASAAANAQQAAAAAVAAPALAAITSGALTPPVPAPAPVAAPHVAAAEPNDTAADGTPTAGAEPGLAVIEQNPTLYAEAFPAAQPVGTSGEVSGRSPVTTSGMPALPRTAVRQAKAEPIVIPIVNVPLPTVVSEWIRDILPNPDEPLKLEDFAIILAALAAAVIASMTTMAVANGMIGRARVKHAAWRVAGRRYRPGFEWPMAAAAAEDAKKRPPQRGRRAVEDPPLRKVG